MDAGLADVLAAETVLSQVDGEAGRLVIRGLSLADLSGRRTAEEAMHLLWSGFFEDLPAPGELARRLARARVRAYEALPRLDAALLDLGPTRALRVLLARFGDGEDLDTALELAAGAAVGTAAVARACAGKATIAPDPDLSQAADFLRMLTGRAPGAAESKALDAYLVTICDHGLNASTFAARVVASTRAGLGSAVVAGLSALKGPLHGGAPGPVLDMLDAIGSADNAESWIDTALDRGERLMGFGHRIYKVRDPRADALKAALGTLPREKGRLTLAETVERTALARLAERKPDRRLDTNVEFFTALLLEALEVPRDAFTPVFAIGRITGWIAHAKEQIATGRIIRPRSIYVGPAPVSA